MQSQAIYKKLSPEARQSLLALETRKALALTAEALSLMLVVESMPSKPSAGQADWAVSAAWQLGRRAALEDAMKAIGGLPDAADKYSGQ